jgi:hypothetical protein
MSHCHGCSHARKMKLFLLSSFVMISVELARSSSHHEHDQFAPHPRLVEPSMLRSHGESVHESRSSISCSEQDVLVVIERGARQLERKFDSAMKDVKLLEQVMICFSFSMTHFRQDAASCQRATLHLHTYPDSYSFPM